MNYKTENNNLISHRSKINIFCDGIEYRVRHINKIKDCINSIVISEKKRLIELNIIITDDANMLSINQQYLGHDTYTDTITFPYNEYKKDVYGDVYISIDMVRENAKSFKCKTQEELFRIMVHGTLHLCGYKDKESHEEKDIMFDKQEKYVRQHLLSIN